MIVNMIIILRWSSVMFFKDWKQCDQSIVGMAGLNLDRFYYMQAQAWHLKGYLGGTHSYCTFFHDNKWMVVEMTDIETLTVQNAEVIYQKTDGADYAPFISNRSYNAKWFGHVPYVVDICATPTYDEIAHACDNYPINKFKILTSNCNTFTSYLISTLKLDLRRPLRSVGFKNARWWKKKYNV